MAFRTDNLPKQNDDSLVWGIWVYGVYGVGAKGMKGFAKTIETKVYVSVN